jgi:hypothetical protein
VAEEDVRATAFYRKHGFHLVGAGKSGFIKMTLQLKKT